MQPAQFVPFRQFRGNSVLLAAEVLAEVPDQVVRYMLDNKIAPRPPVMAPQVAVTVTASASQAPSAPPLTPTASTVVPASFVSLPPPPGPPPPALLPPLQQGLFNPSILALYNARAALFSMLSHDISLRLV